MFFNARRMQGMLRTFHLDDDMIWWSLLYQQFLVMLLYEVGVNITRDELAVMAEIQYKVHVCVNTHNLFMNNSNFFKL